MVRRYHALKIVAQAGHHYEKDMDEINRKGAMMFFFNRTNINDAVEEWRNTVDAVLIDVREVDEFRAGHIPGAINVPFSGIDTISVPKDKQIFVYCLRGTRSSQAARKMKKMGYTKVKSIGGIMEYKGRIEK